MAARSLLVISSCLLTPAASFRVVTSHRMGARLRGAHIVMIDKLPARDRPGNYVSAYGSALGVSVAAVLCGELIPLPGSVDTAVPALGRVAACTSLPLLIACFGALRIAALRGPQLLRTPIFEQLNLGLALACVAAVVVSPRPLLPVVVARGGSALLCLEVWSQSSSDTKAGDPLSEVLSAARGLANALRRALELLCSGIGARATKNTHGEEEDARTAAWYAACALAHAAAAMAACAAPGTMATALWPVVAPGTAAARLAVSTQVLYAVGAVTLANAVAARPRTDDGEAMRPFRWINRALLLSMIAHLVVQGGATLQASSVVGGLALSHGRMTLMACVQLVQLGTAWLAASKRPLFYN